MASSSTNRQLEESASSTSTSAGPSIYHFSPYEPPTTKLAFRSDKSYHVFLSFRGPDVRRTLVDHLCEALSAAGLVYFLDNKDLKKGERIWESLETAIDSSAIRIPIFSDRYAGSAWCLKEATAMLRTTDLIIPLFYHIDPTHVRYPENDKSPYKKSFLKHCGHTDRYKEEEINGWKNALEQICERSGWSTDSTGGFEAGLVKMVVNDLIQTLDRVPLEVAMHPVGLDSAKDSMIQKLNLASRNEVVKIGIWGIGGVGKTTVAKAVYNQVYLDFDAASFVSNIGTTAEANGLTGLQKIVLRDLCKYDGEVNSDDKGKVLFRDRLERKRVLLILDDVVTVEQLHALVGEWLCPGSRVIITSKDEHILNLAQVPSENIREIKGLDIDKGLQLFSWHAFLKASPTPSYESLSRKIVDACKGHPLSLEVIGSYLYDKKNESDRVCWEEAAHDISLEEKIYKRLYRSYKDLTDVEKEIFVDIACCFIGERQKFPVLFWQSLQYKKVEIAIRNLKMKLLIKIDNKGFFSMHDHLRDMGRNIAKKEKEGARLWEATHFSKIDFFRLRFGEGNPQRLQMLYRPDLQYLHLKNVIIDDMTEDSLPESLICLRLEDCTFASGNYRALINFLAAVRKQLHSRPVVKSWQLEMMQLKGFSDFGSLPLPSLISLPYIQLLQHLDFERCRGLDYLPDSICKLSNLKTLSLEWCDMLKELPSDIGNLSKLQQLHLTGCDKLNSLPLSIGMLSELQCLDLEMCFYLESIPDTIGGLSQLQQLNLEMCFNLKNLHHSIGDLSQLRQLNLKMCLKLNTLPETIGRLSQLERLDLEGCASLNNLPGTLGELSHRQNITKPPIAKTSRANRFIQSYDVFLSYRGPDVRKSIMGDLFQALSTAGAYVFMDRESLEPGDNIGLAIERAIESSAILIPVFSKRYAESAWCLREAAAMLNSPGQIIPLYYHVDPTHVRYPEMKSSPYREAFLKHYSKFRFPREQIDNWKGALQKISDLRGWSVDATEGSEARQLKTLVSELMPILSRVKKPSEEMDDAKNVVVRKLNPISREDIVKVVIWGMGSCVAQTAVAKAVYKQVHVDFEVASIVFNVHATSLPNLQTQILKDLIKYEGEVQSVEQGKTLFRDHLAGKRVLLLLDDVDSVVELDALVGNWLAPGSRVIITSTSKHILDVVRDSSECIPVEDKFFVIGEIQHHP